MKKNLKLNSLNAKKLEKLEAEKLGNIKGGVLGTCSNSEGSCTNNQTWHSYFADAIEQAN